MFGFFPDDGDGDWALVVVTREEIETSTITAIRINLGFIGISLSACQLLSGETDCDLNWFLTR